MFAAVGRAITQWSFVEKSLSDLLGVCLGGATAGEHGEVDSPNLWTALWLFYSVENCLSKVQLVNAALEAHVMHSSAAEELKGEWVENLGKGKQTCPQT